MKKMLFTFALLTASSYVVSNNDPLTTVIESDNDIREMYQAWYQNSTMYIGHEKKCSEQCIYGHKIRLHISQEEYTTRFGHLSAQEAYNNFKTPLLKQLTRRISSDVYYESQCYPSLDNTRVVIEASMVQFNEMTGYLLAVSAEEYATTFAHLSKKETYKLLKARYQEIEQQAQSSNV